MSRAFIERWRARGGPHLGATSTIPTLSQAADRVSNIIADRPARFNVVDNTDDSGAPPPIADDEFGLEQVRNHDHIIEKEAHRQGVEPDLVRAIVFVENSHGWYDEYLDRLGLNRTIRPMNIDVDLWRDLGISRQTARDPRVNIRAGTTLLKRLVERIENPTPRKVAALWQLTGAEHTDNREIRNYVARVGQLYRARPWASAQSRP